MSEIDPNKVAGYIDRVGRLAPLIREHAAESEARAQLAPAVAEAFHEAGLFRILLPARMNGGDLTMPESLRVFEAAAAVEGSVGWNLAICAGGPIFGHFIARDAFEKLFVDPRAVIAGSLNAATTQAFPCAGGYRFTGKATNASGSAQASWLMVGGVVLKDGVMQFAGEIPLMRAGLFPIKEAKILKTWSVSGMRGTGSNDCAFENAFAPEELTFEWPEPQPAWQGGPFGNIPLLVQLGGGIASVALGVARHAIDAFKEVAGAKVPVASRSLLRERPQAQIQNAQAEGLLQAARAYLYQASDDVWRRGEQGATFDWEARAAARLAVVTAVKLAAQAVDIIYDAAGLSSIQTSCPIERCWRDVHAVTQHITASSGRYENVGRILLGLQPGVGVI
jgi:indole-3-acetate monooxygenase